jgi:hypothetical protein
MVRRPFSLSPFLLLLLAAFGGAPPPPAAPPPPPEPAPPVAVSPPPAAPAKTVRKALVMQGRQRGSLVATTAPDGTITSAFDMQWNGRGPHCDSTIHLAPDGTIASYDAHGHHMMGAPVEESFAIDAGHAHWKSHEETGEAAPKGAAFFVPIAWDPEATGLLVEAIVKAGGTLALLPGGTAKAEKVGEVTLHAGDKQRHVTAYAISGLDLTPDIQWLDDDGTWFGSAHPRMSLLPEEWQSAVDTLVAKKLEIDRDLDKRAAQRLADSPPAAGLAFTHARVLDVEKGRWIPDQTVVVVGETIKAVGPAKSTKVPAGAETVDLGGKALLPGLWDMHSHLGNSSGALDIGTGVTTARDVGNDPDLLDDYKKRFDEGSAIGPHVLRAGFIEGRGEKAADSKITAETVEEAKAGVDFYAKRGYEMIKIYNSVKTELVPVITKEAHAHGMTVTGHIPVHMLANEAVKAGYDGIEHANMLFLNFFADHDTDTRTPLRFTIVGDKAADFDLTAKPVQDFFALLRDHHTVIDPTVGAFEDLLVGQQGKVTPGLEWLADRLPIQARRDLLIGGLPPSTKEKADTYLRSFDKMLHLVRALQDAKVTVVAGTDSTAGLMLDHELELFVRGGLSPADALRDATIVPARAMKLEKKTGSIAVGKMADLVVVDGDPLAAIGDIKKVVTTVRGGVIYPAKETLDVVEVKYWE